MTDECGVTGGCGACPLAGMCGDGAPERLQESDPRYLGPFLAGMQAARMAIVKRGWTIDVPMTTADATNAIDRERVEAVRILTREAGPLDAPDIDPNEPRPAGGCCGGGCCG